MAHTEIKFTSTDKILMRSLVRNVQSLPGDDCYSDHKLLVGNRKKIAEFWSQKMSRRQKITDKKSLCTYLG